MVEVYPFTSVYMERPPSSNVAKRGSEEWKRKISETKKRQYKEGILKPWNKGLPPHKQPRYGKPHSREAKRKISEARIGKPHPHKGYIMSEEAKRKLSIAHSGKKLSEEHKKKIKERMKHNHPWKGRRHTEETKRKISIAHMGKKLTEETKQKIRLASMKRRRLGTKNKDTDIEKIIQAGLNNLGCSFEKHKIVCDVCQPDMSFSKLKIAVFCDGDYWHSKDFKGGAVWKRDRRQDKILFDNGWTVLRFWGSEIKSNPEKYISEIQEVVNQ